MTQTMCTIARRKMLSVGEVLICCALLGVMNECVNMVI